MSCQKRRLSKKKDIDIVFKQGVSAFDSFIGLKAIKGNGLNSRFSIIVAAKKIPLAVQRNLLKRYYREFARETLLFYPGVIDFVIIISPAAKSESYQKLQQSFKLLFRRLVYKLQKNHDQSSALAKTSCCRNN